MRNRNHFEEHHFEEHNDRLKNILQLGPEPTIKQCVRKSQSHSWEELPAIMIRKALRSELLSLLTVARYLGQPDIEIIFRIPSSPFQV